MAKRFSAHLAEDTIYAPATAPGLGAVAVIRLSGPQTFSVLKRLTRQPLPPLRYAALRGFFDPRSGDLLDRGLLLRFESGASYTGEDSGELQLHGSPMVVRRVSSVLDMMGVRLAEPGEFTERAFGSGRLDFAQVEGLSELISAQTERGRRRALRALEGDVGRESEGWAREILEVTALIEACIDFVDEDIGEGPLKDAAQRLDRLQSTFDVGVLSSDLAVEEDRPLMIAIVGPPNAGKSSLLNAFLARDAAIVTPVAGTTRDLVSGRGRVADLDFELIDTAGLRETDDQLEQLGVQRALSAAEQADRRIFVVSGDTVADARAVFDIYREGDVVLWNKSDVDDRYAPHVPYLPAPPRLICAHDGSAPSLFGDLISAWRSDEVSTLDPFLGSARRRQILSHTLDRVVAAKEYLAAGTLEMAVEALRLSVVELRGLVSAPDQEAVLGEIFSRFCLGK